MRHRVVIQARPRKSVRSCTFENELFQSVTHHKFNSYAQVIMSVLKTYSAALHKMTGAFFYTSPRDTVGMIIRLVSTCVGGNGDHMTSLC